MCRLCKSFEMHINLMCPKASLARASFEARHRWCVECPDHPEHTFLASVIDKPTLEEKDIDWHMYWQSETNFPSGMIVVNPFTVVSEAVQRKLEEDKLALLRLVPDKFVFKGKCIGYAGERSVFQNSEGAILEISNALLKVKLSIGDLVEDDFGIGGGVRVRPQALKRPGRFAAIGMTLVLLLFLIYIADKFWRWLR